MSTCTDSFFYFYRCLAGYSHVDTETGCGLVETLKVWAGRSKQGYKYKMNTGVKKPNKKVVPPPTKKELQELEQDYIAQCTEVSEL